MRQRAEQKLLLHVGGSFFLGGEGLLFSSLPFRVFVFNSDIELSEEDLSHSLHFLNRMLNPLSSKCIFE